MSGYAGQNCFVTPKYFQHGSDQPLQMDARLTREHSRYGDSYNSCLGLAEEQLFRGTYDQRQLSLPDSVRFFQDEYDALLLKVESQISGIRTKHAWEELHNVSELVDETLYEEQRKREMTLGSSLRKTPDVFNIDDMLSWKQSQDRKHALFMMHEQAMCDMEDEEFIFKSITNNPKRFDDTVRMKRPIQNATRRGFKTSPKPETQLAENNQKQKKPNCWHFMKGHCKRGKYCDFNHDSKHDYPDACKVFLGGLPFHITEDALRQQLSERGFNVVNKPKVYGGFSPKVCLASPAEATRLIKEGPITIGGMNVDVRSYQPFTKKNQEKLLDVSRRSVFLGGLRKGTTSQMIKKQLESMGLKIVNYPLIKAGFSPQVTLSSEKQALKLVKMVKLQINGAWVDIRPYAGINENTKFQGKHSAQFFRVAAYVREGTKQFDV